MIPALLVALSLPGCCLSWALLRRERRASDLPTPPEHEVVVFGFDSAGLVD